MSGEPDYDFDPTTGQTGESTTGAPAGPSAPGAQPSATPPVDASTGGTPGAAGGSEDGAHVPSYRLREVTERNRQLEAAVQTLTQQLSELSRQGMPARPSAPTLNPEEQAIRDQFFKLFPNAKAIFDNADRIAALAEQGPMLQQQTEHYWTNLGATTLRSLNEAISAVYGDKMDPWARQHFERSFIGWIEHDPQAQQRYMAGDPSLVTEFFTRLKSVVLDPVARSALANAARRAERIARVPRTGPSTQAVGAPIPKPKTEDELHDAAWDALQQRS